MRSFICGWLGPGCLSAGDVNYNTILDIDIVGTITGLETINEFTETEAYILKMFLRNSMIRLEKVRREKRRESQMWLS